ncbi:XRE family transcriptional regulator, partial [bacterium]
MTSPDKGSPAPALGAEIRKLRESRGLSLGTAAARGGVAKATLSYWENGRRTPSGSVLARYLDALGAPARDKARLISLTDPAFAGWFLPAQPLGAPVSVGQVLRAMRIRRGLTQAELATAIHTGQSTVAKWESGDLAPGAEAIHAACFA